MAIHWDERERGLDRRFLIVVMVGRKFVKFVKLVRTLVRLVSDL